MSTTRQRRRSCSSRETGWVEPCRVVAACLLGVLLGCTADAGSDSSNRRGSPGDDAGSFTAPAGFPLPFTTRVPSGFRVVAGTEGEGGTVHFAHTQTLEAFLHLFVHPAAHTRQSAEEVVRAVAESYGPIREFGEIQPIPRPSWSSLAFDISGRKQGAEPMAGFVALGRQGERWYHILVQYPRSQEAAFSAVFEQILRNWRWADTGEPLERRPPS